jgi:hypothetical protein
MVSLPQKIGPVSFLVSSVLKVPSIFFSCPSWQTLYVNWTFPNATEWTNANLRLYEGSNVAQYLLPRGLRASTNFVLSATISIPGQMILVLNTTQLTVRLTRGEEGNPPLITNVTGLAFSYRIDPNCPIGYARSSSSVCTPCLPGFFKGTALDSDRCKPCPRGTYSSFAAEALCTDVDLAAGEYTDKEGLSEPLTCPTTTFPLSNAGPCVPYREEYKALEQVIPSVLGVGVVAAVVCFIVSVKLSPKGAEHSSLPALIVEATSLACDVLYIIFLYAAGFQVRPTSDPDELMVTHRNRLFFYLYVAVVLVSIVVNIALAMVILTRELHSNAGFKKWARDMPALLSVFIVVSSANVSVLSVMWCRWMNLHAFTSPAGHDLRMNSRKYSVASIVFKKGSQLCIQAAIIFFEHSPNFISILTLSSTCILFIFSVLSAVLDHLSWTSSRKVGDIKDNHRGYAAGNPRLSIASAQDNEKDHLNAKHVRDTPSESLDNQCPSCIRRRSNMQSV